MRSHDAVSKFAYVSIFTNVSKCVHLNAVSLCKKVISYMTTWQLSYMGRAKYSFSPRKDIQRTKILRLSNTENLSKVKRHLFTSLKGNNVTIREPRANISCKLQVN